MGHGAASERHSLALIVAKFGGTSVGSTERIQQVAERLVRMRRAGNEVVAVVSAMGKSTDDLLALAGQVSHEPSSREMDMLLSTGEQVSMSILAMAIEALGEPAISLTGGQVGIVTDATHRKAKIREVKADRIRRELSTGKMVVVAGFRASPVMET